MNFKANILIVFVVLGFLVLPGTGQAVEFQIAGGVTSITPPDDPDFEYTSTSGAMPMIALGFELGNMNFLYLQYDSFRYQLEAASKVSGVVVGEFEITDTAYSVVYVPRFERFDLRFGYGIVNESTEVTKPAGVTIDDASGSQLFAGLDFRFNEMFGIGVEMRSVSVDTTWNLPDGSTLETDNNHDVTIVRGVINF